MSTISAETYTGKQTNNNNKKLHKARTAMTKTQRQEVFSINRMGVKLQGSGVK